MPGHAAEEVGCNTLLFMEQTIWPQHLRASHPGVAGLAKCFVPFCKAISGPCSGLDSPSRIRARTLSFPSYNFPLCQHQQSCKRVLLGLCPQQKTSVTTAFPSPSPSGNLGLGECTHLCPQSPTEFETTGRQVQNAHHRRMMLSIK